MVLHWMNGIEQRLLGWLSAISLLAERSVFRIILMAGFLVNASIDKSGPRLGNFLVVGDYDLVANRK
jgi:hypothetical protein